MQSILYRRALPVMVAVIMAATVFTVPVFSQGEAYAQSVPVAQPYKNTITSARSIMAGKTLTFTARGDRQSAVGTINGETKYVPYKWELDGKRDYSGYFKYGDYTKSIKLRYPSRYELEVEFRCYQYVISPSSTNPTVPVGKWVLMRDDYDDYDDDKEVVVKVKGMIKFNTNNGRSLNKKSKIVTPGNTYGELPKAKRAGYKFKGWYTSKRSGKKITSGKKVSLSKAKTTLYARWGKKRNKRSNYQRNSSGYIGKTRAKNIALKRSGGGNVVKCHFEWDDGIPQYEIEIWRGNWEYDIDVHAKTGRIIDYDKDYEDDYDYDD